MDKTAGRYSVDEHLSMAGRYLSQRELKPSPSGFNWLYAQAAGVPIAYKPGAHGDLAFKEEAPIPTKHGQWRVFHRDAHQIPNFESAPTIVQSRLGIYVTESKEGMPEHLPFLHQSEQPIPEDAFRAQLQTISKYYLERPLILGIPSRVSTNAFTYLGLSMVPMIATVASLLYDYSHAGTLSSTSAIGLTSSYLGPFISVGLSVLSQKHADRKIGTLEHRFAGDNVFTALEMERWHAMGVQVKTELYHAMLQEGLALQPGEFLRIFDEIPNSLVARRKAEIEKKSVDTVVRDTLDRMVTIAKALNPQRPAATAN